MLYFFLTASKTIYNIDCCKVICFNSSERINLSYNKKWVSSPERLRDGASVTIIFCEYVSQSESYRYHPIRIATIHRLQQDGGYFLITLELAGYFDYEAGTSPGNIHDGLSGLETHPNSGKKFVVYHHRLNHKFDDFKWQSAFRHLGSLHSFERHTFLKAVNFTLRRNSEVILLGDSFLTGKTIALQINKEYEISFYAYSNSEVELPEIRIPRSLGKVIGPFSNQFGAGVMLSYVFSTTDINQRFFIVARIPMKNGRALGPHFIQSTKVSGISRKSIVAFVFLVIGVVAGNTSTLIACFLSINEFMVSTMSGLIFSASLYFLLKKVPYKLEM